MLLWVLNESLRFKASKSFIGLFFKWRSVSRVHKRIITFLIQKVSKCGFRSRKYSVLRSGDMLGTASAWEIVKLNTKFPFRRSQGGVNHQLFQARFDQFLSINPKVSAGVKLKIINRYRSLDLLWSQVVFPSVKASFDLLRNVRACHLQLRNFFWLIIQMNLQKAQSDNGVFFFS